MKMFFVKFYRNIIILSADAEKIKNGNSPYNFIGIMPSCNFEYLL